MITSIFLKNFQRHKRLKIEFGEGVTTLVGPTSAGKSAVFRALRLVCLNKPNGDAQIRHGQKSFLIVLGVDGHKIKRKKGTVNVYLYDGQSYRSFGNSVPRDISELLTVDDNNFQRQLDLPFWFTESPGQVSRNLNQIVDLEIIDTTLANVSKEARDAKAVVDVTRQRHHEARVKRNELRWVPDMLAEWAQVEAAQEKADECAKKGTALAILLREAVRHQQTKRRLTSVSVAGANAVVAGELLAGLRQKAMRLAELIALGRNAERWAKVKLPDIGPLLALRKEADGIAEKRRNLEMLVEEAARLEKEKCHFEIELKRLSKSLAASKPANVCPRCGQPIVSSSQPAGTSTLHCHPPRSGRGKKTGSASRPGT